MNKVVIFDFDGTITTEDSFNRLLKYTFGKTRFTLGMLKCSPYIFLYKMGIVTNAKIKDKIFKTFFKNKTYEFYEESVQKYLKKDLNNIISKEMQDRIKFYHDEGYKTIILSASFSEWVASWAKENFIDIVVTSKYKCNKNNLNDFNIIEEKSCYGKNKIKMLNDVIDLKKYDHIVAYGDSKSDMYFINLADEKYLVKKNRIYLVDECAIVTDGLWRKSISAIRSIGKHGVKVCVTGDTYLSTGMWSRYCNKKKKIVNASSNEESFGSDILKVISEYPSKPVLVPMEEPTMDWCSKNYDLLKDKCYLLIPEYSSLKIALSKADTIKTAIKCGTPCPKTFFPKNAKELIELIKTEKLTDYVIKPYHGSGSSGLLYGSSSEEVDLEEHWKKYGELILQERIPSEGEGVGVSIIMDKNHVVKGCFAHKRLEQYPNSGGPSTQRIGINNPKLIESSIKLLKSLNWVGVAMVEWKYNMNIHEYVLMEINPRFWGSLELAVRSGVDFPFLYYQLAKDRGIKEVKEYSTDIVCRWLLPGDILRYLTKKDKEPLHKFLKHCIKDSEEWDKSDKRGFFANIWCQGLLVINPKYWKYIRR